MGNSFERGLNAESIFASTFSIVNVEYRYLLEENSFLFAFFNGAYYENKAVNRNIVDRPFGFGAGMSFETKAGIFSISYALGKQFDNPIEFRSANCTSELRVCFKRVNELLGLIALKQYSHLF